MQSIGYNATISASHVHRFCLTQAKSKLVENAKVLDIGAGSGFLTACMAYMVGSQGHVVAIENVPELTQICKENLIRVDVGLANRVTVIRDVGRFPKLGEHEVRPYQFRRMYSTQT